MALGSTGGIQAEGSLSTTTAVEGGASVYQASLWGDAWYYEDLAAGGRLALDALGIELPLDEVYDDIL